MIALPLFAACTLSAHDADDATRRAVAHLDYVAGDYAGAVKKGRVVDAHEYEEALELLAETKALAAESATPAAVRAVEAVAVAVEAKAPAAEVKRLVADARGFLLAKADIAPPEGLSKARAAATFAARCAGCHGADGAPGTAAATLDPPPRDFRDPAVMDAFTPLRAYSAITDGLEGTAMSAFPDLSEAERWELAFWVVGLRHGEGVAPAEPLTAEKLADASDAALRARYTTDALAWLRREAPYGP
ncbi:MAG: c-type cytochrome [Myxococcota bacterium]